MEKNLKWQYSGYYWRNSKKLNRYERKHKQHLILNDYLLHEKLTVVSLVILLFFFFGGGESDEHSSLIK